MEGAGSKKKSRGGVQFEGESTLVKTAISGNSVRLHTIYILYPSLVDNSSFIDRFGINPGVADLSCCGQTGEISPQPWW